MGKQSTRIMKYLLMESLWARMTAAPHGNHKTTWYNQSRIRSPILATRSFQTSWYLGLVNSNKPVGHSVDTILGRQTRPVKITGFFHRNWKERERTYSDEGYHYNCKDLCNGKNWNLIDEERWPANNYCLMVEIWIRFIQIQQDFQHLSSKNNLT